MIVQIGSTHGERLLGLYDRDGRLNYVGSVDVTAEQKRAIGKLPVRKKTRFFGRQLGAKSHWSTEPAGPWRPASPQKVVEVRYDRFSDGRFRHTCTLVRFRPDKAPEDRVLEEQEGPPIFKSFAAGRQKYSPRLMPRTAEDRMRSRLTFAIRFYPVLIASARLFVRTPGLGAAWRIAIAILPQTLFLTLVCVPFPR